MRKGKEYSKVVWKEYNENGRLDCLNRRVGSKECRLN